MMKIDLNRWKLGLAAALIAAAGAGWFVHGRLQAEGDVEPQVAARSVADQKLVDTTMAAPEQFDCVVESSRPADTKPERPEQQEVSVATTEGDSDRTETVVASSISRVSRPNLLSAVEKPAPVNSHEEPTSVEDLYSWGAYSSMRKDAINDPDSQENRAGIVALMKARQKRLGQNQ